jgi:hypothetical protein
MSEWHMFGDRCKAAFFVGSWVLRNAFSLEVYPYHTLTGFKLYTLANIIMGHRVSVLFVKDMIINGHLGLMEINLFKGVSWQGF